jgi:peptide-methionine (S)-S-oxide reductase
VVGYTGGSKPNPTYRNMQDATESIRVEFNPAHHSVGVILEAFFQGVDAFGRGCGSGRQYRSAIWYVSAEQKAAIDKAVALHCQRRGKQVADFRIPIEAATPFYRAEEYHQHYTAKQRGQYRRI